MATAAVSSLSLLLLAAAAAIHLLLLPSAQACPLAYTKCTEYTTTDTATIRKVEETPFPVHASKAVTFNISAKAVEPIPTYASVYFTLSQRAPKGSYSFEHIGELGGYASQSQGSDTVVGDFTISQAFNLPSNDHALQIYTCQMRIMIWDWPSTMPTCINFDFTVLPH